MAALLCPRSATACFRQFSRSLAPITASAAFSSKTPPRRTWTAEETQRVISLPSKQIAQHLSQTAGSTFKTSSVIRLRREGLTLQHIAREFSTAQRNRNAEQVQSRQEDISPKPSIPDTLLTWDRFFNLRRNRRWINAGCSLVTAGVSVLVLAPMLAQTDFDTWGAQIAGIDPVFVLGISTFGIAALGWLLGPTVGNGGFRLWAARKGWTQEIAGKEKSFYARIRKYRADPSSSSPQNPIPDYYGEKIKSVKDYRRWLKDQRAFNLKKNKNML